MTVQDLSARFSATAADREKAMFTTLFIAANRLQTLFDRRIPALSLKQFLLLALARQAGPEATFTQLGTMLGCSRQNIQKLAAALERKGFAVVEAQPGDARAQCLRPTDRAEAYFAREFAPYAAQLHTLFSVYTEAEAQALFGLLTRLYDGIAALEGLENG